MTARPKCTIHDHHYGWDNSLPPALEVESGETIEFEVIDSGGGQFTPTSTHADVTALDFSKINPVTGPVYVHGAEPGDALQVDMLEFRPSGFGWTAIIPGFGLLADEFADPYLKLWQYGDRSAEFLPGIQVPVRPFPGTIGNAPAEAGPHSIVPPRSVGGNMDIRDLTAGSTLHLPVAVSGALFSVGDTHAAQGDGEVCGTAIESAMHVTLRFTLKKAAHLKTPRFSTPGPVTGHIDQMGYQVTTGIGPDLYAAAQDATRSMVDFMTSEYGLSPQDAYLLCSVAADLRISEIVDAPNWLVSLYLPRSIFT
ncbi:acetamidase/formamidase family protein [Deinococcus arenicola]|uniref:Acetamidase/formamidase family protein n=1 Tax=Deinococcus arenicola TaxID=2994950 RepID=A0ABU4DVL8_9DEIO|nr:acetamidase/formamidase family protein [Deinococcus sp. ZS9-10]MDV6376493.1 acetamidase/formamidase family protein [Deinococcus sp. ZS9-10]